MDEQRFKNDTDLRIRYMKAMQALLTESIPDRGIPDAAIDAAKAPKS